MDTDIITVEGTTYVKDPERGEWGLGDESGVDIPFQPTDFVPSSDGDNSTEDFQDVVFLGEE